MFFTKRIRKIFERRIEDLEKRLSQLECKHPIQSIIFEWNGIAYWRKSCHLCHKTVEIYANEGQYLKARNDLMRELIKINEKKIKG